jgi:hypothetical protein
MSARISGGEVVVGREVKQLAVELEHGADACATQAHGTASDRVEDGLDVRGRGGDDAQDLARRGLLLERLGEVVVLGLELLEEPDVLDGDDRLVGEGLEQRDLASREWPRPSLGTSSPDGDSTDRRPALQHRHGKEAPVTCGFRHLSTRRREVGIALEVAYVNDPSTPSSGRRSRGRVLAGLSASRRRRRR